MKQASRQFFQLNKVFLLCLSLAVITTLLGASVLYNARSGILFSSESFKYLTHYLGPKTLPEKIFDFRGNDNLTGSYYRPRDLGNVFNYLDAELVLLSLRFGMPGLISFIHYGAMFLVSLVNIYCAGIFFGKRVFLLSLLFTAIYLTSPGVFFTGVYVRATKSVICVFIAVLIWIMIGIGKKVIRPGTLTMVAVSVLGLMLSLTDEIGSAFLLGFFLASGYLGYGMGRKEFRPVLLPLFVSILLTFAYRYYLGPFLVYTVIGIWPVVWDIRLSESTLFSFYILIDAAGTFVDYLRLLFGNTSRELAVFVYDGVMLLVASQFRKTRSNTRKNTGGAWVYLFLIGTTYVIAIIIAMAMTHPPVLDFPWKMHYYVLPFHTLMIILFSFIVYDSLSQLPKMETAIVIIISSFVILNAIALPEEFKIRKAQARDLNWENSREITESVLKDEPVTVVNPDTHAGRVSAIQIIKWRLGKK